MGPTAWMYQLFNMIKDLAKKQQRRKANAQFGAVGDFLSFLAIPVILNSLDFAVLKLPRHEICGNLLDSPCCVVVRNGSMDKTLTQCDSAKNLISGFVSRMRSNSTKVLHCLFDAYELEQAQAKNTCNVGLFPLVLGNKSVQLFRFFWKLFHGSVLPLFFDATPKKMDPLEGIHYIPSMIHLKVKPLLQTHAVRLLLDDVTSDSSHLKVTELVTGPDELLSSNRSDDTAKSSPFELYVEAIRDGLEQDQNVVLERPGPTMKHDGFAAHANNRLRFVFVPQYVDFVDVLRTTQKLKKVLQEVILNMLEEE